MSVKNTSDDNATQVQIHPPVAQQKNHRFSHHGIAIDDPYAWLRDPNYPEVNDPEILDYLKQENAYFEGFMQPLRPMVDELFEEMKARQAEEDASVPYEKNGYHYQWRFNKGNQYRTWYRASAAEPNNWQNLLDENELAAGHKYFRLGALAVSPNTKFLAYSVDIDGSERFTLHLIDIEDRQPISSPIDNTLGNPIWDAASSAMLYVVVSEQWRPYQVRLRDLHSDHPAEVGDSVLRHHGNDAGEGSDVPLPGTKTDALVYEEQDGGFFVGLDESQSERYVFIHSGSHTSQECYFVPKDNFKTAPQCIQPRRADHDYFVDHDGENFLIRSNSRHSNFDIFTTPTDAPGEANWQIAIAGDKQHYLVGFLTLQNYLIVAERIAGLDQVRIVDTAAITGVADTIQSGDKTHLYQNHHYINFADSAYEVNFSANPNFQSQHLRLSYSSMTTPASVLEYSLSSRTMQTLKTTEIPSGYSPQEFTSQRLLAPGRDGVNIPISVVHHKNTPLDGSAPLYLYAYGAYGHAIPPSFSASRISLLERGFIFAIAHIRGGDDLGYDWYTQGKLLQRTNTFNDFVDVAQHLIEQNITAAGKIAIAGGSAGGELMGAVVNQAPQLWGAVAAHVPFVDVLNTMLDDTLPLTPIEWDEWGNPIEDLQAFNYILSYSPYDQIQAGEFPPMLVTAGLNDPRVTYWEPAKYVAKLRGLKTDTNPLLLKTNMGAGHGGESGRFDSLKELAEEYAFFISTLAVSNE